MSFCDILASISTPLIWSKALPPPFGNGSRATCNAQGFFGQFVTATVFYSGALALSYLLSIKYGYKEPQLAKMEPIVHVLILAFVLISGGVSIHLELYNPTPFSCNMNAFPMGCPSRTPCIRGENANVWRFPFRTIPEYATIAFCTVAMIMIYCSVREVEIKARRWTFGARMPSEEGCHFREPSPHPQEQEQQQQQQQSSPSEQSTLALEESTETLPQLHQPANDNASEEMGLKTGSVAGVHDVEETKSQHAPDEDAKQNGNTCASSSQVLLSIPDVDMVEEQNLQLALIGAQAATQHPTATRIVPVPSGDMEKATSLKPTLPIFTDVTAPTAPDGTKGTSTKLPPTPNVELERGKKADEGTGATNTNSSKVLQCPGTEEASNEDDKPVQPNDVSFSRMKRSTSLLRSTSSMRRSNTSPLSRDVGIQGICFILALLLTWTVPTIVRCLIRIGGRSLSFQWFIAVNVFLPLQGFFNFLVYIRPKLWRRRQKGSSRSGSRSFSNASPRRQRLGGASSGGLSA
eukprot:Sro998_g229580.1 n/a (520) ;mRNA; r:37446-39005